MRLEIGNPGSGTIVAIDLPTDAAPELVPERVVAALNVLKAAGDTWVEWSREHETPEQTEMRELMERNSELQKRALEQQNVELEQMLSGTTEGIGPVGRDT